MNKALIVKILLVIAMIPAVAGCGSPGDPILDTLYTQDVIPGSPNTYSIGSAPYPYEEGYLGFIYSEGGQFGSDTDYMTVSSEGTITLVGTARVVNSIWVDAGGLKAPGAKPATLVPHGILETPAWRFASQALAANQESISFSMRIPERMDRTVSSRIEIGWSTTTADPGDNTEQVKWQLELLWTALNESTIVGAEESVTILTSSSTVAEGFAVSMFTILSLPDSYDVCIHCRVTRLSADAQDTIADDVELHGVCLSWVSDKLGSEYE